MPGTINEYIPLDDDQKFRLTMFLDEYKVQTRIMNLCHELSELISPDYLQDRAFAEIYQTVITMKGLPYRMNDEERAKAIEEYKVRKEEERRRLKEMRDNM